jgi:hypothetical protein
VTRISELGTTQAATYAAKNTIYSQRMSVASCSLCCS